MNLLHKNGETVTESAGFLISMLIRYPEIGTINFNPEDQVITLSFSLGQVLDKSRLEKFQRDLYDCLQVFHYLENRNVAVLGIDFSLLGQIAVIEVKRDLESVTKNEISLLISFLEQELGEWLVRDGDHGETYQEEDLLLQEELIGHMLENLKVSLPEKKLIAFREEGKVRVFKK
ncbi:MAG: hypothetical protein GX779_03685 [Clostridia bacterium]|jgi:hypothetical protein|nr:hypothetical protein [Clostridia bacterium]